MLNPIQLDYFIKTVDCRSLNKAAKELFISQPALTKQLTQLEKQVGQVLFLRKPSGIEVTQAGRFLYDKAKFIIHQLAMLEAELAEYANRKCIRIGALPSIATFYLPSVLKDFENEGYDITVHVRDTSHELLDMLNGGEIDIGFLQDAKNFHFQLPSKYLFAEHYWALLPIKHELAERDSLTLDELLQYKMVLYKDPCDIRTSFRRICSQMGVQPPLGLELEFNDSVHSFVAQDHGVSIVPEMAAKGLKHPDLIVKPIVSKFAFERSVDIVFQNEMEKILNQVIKKEEGDPEGEL